MQIESMTGFGSSEKGDFMVEVRSLNHKNLDINFNGPSYLYRLDPEIRKRAKKKFNRGRIDIYVSKLRGNQKKIKVNKKLANEHLRAVLALKKELSLKDEIGLDYFASLRDVFMYDDSDIKVSDFTGALDSALQALRVSRGREGKKLVMDINKRMQKVNRYIQKINRRRKKFISTARNGLHDRLRDILDDATVDETRLIQETAILIERSDITEEVVRMKSHLDYMKNIIRAGGTVGKKLDFVIQELRREVNTIGSKSSDLEVTVSVVEIKDELEKIREQIQNLQ